MTMSNIRRMLETSEAEGGGLAATVGSMNTSAVRSPEEEGEGEGGGGGAPEEDSTLGRLELAFI